MDLHQTRPRLPPPKRNTHKKTKRERVRRGREEERERKGRRKGRWIDGGRKTLTYTELSGNDLVRVCANFGSQGVWVQQSCATRGQKMNSWAWWGEEVTETGACMSPIKITFLKWYSQEQIRKNSLSRHRHHRIYLFGIGPWVWNSKTSPWDLINIDLLWWGSRNLPTKKVELKMAHTSNKCSANPREPHR